MALLAWLAAFSSRCSLCYTQARLSRRSKDCGAAHRDFGALSFRRCALIWVAVERSRQPSGGLTELGNRMPITEVMENPKAPQPFAAILGDYYTLTKPEVNLLILMTTSAGYYLGNAGPFRLMGLLNTLVGTLLVASGTATLNQYMERVHDAQMRRTANRPLV